MDTFLTTNSRNAAEFIKRGGIVAFPTETVYGLGANVFDAEAIAKIFVAKNRPNDNPLIAHVANLNQIKLLTTEINDSAQKFIDAFFPSPLTLVLPKSSEVPMIATANLQTIGVRMPKHKLAIEFLEACGVPVVAPSANLSGKPSPTTWEAVREDLDSRIDCILQGETTEIGIESTVVDCTSEIPLILRSGAITIEDLQKIVPETRFHIAKDNEPAKSPGLKHKHYSPKATVQLVKTYNVEFAPHSAFIGLNQPNATFERIKLCNSISEYAHEVFEFFRECDRSNIAAIYCEAVEETGLGIALMDRLKRAAESANKL
jgi:L-threonylcarbamoyladenylate synthase